VIPESEAALTVAAVARRLGVAPATLRTWDRRYGLGPSEHSAGAHRRYSPEDMARLLTMRRLTLDGVAPSEAARAAIASVRAGGPAAGGAGRPGSGATVHLRSAPSEADVLDAYADVEMPADPDALVQAARHGDSAAVRWMLARVQPRDPLEWYAQLVRPAISALGGTPAVEAAGDSGCHRLEASAYAELRSRSAALAARTHGETTTSSATAAALVAPMGRGTDLEGHVLAGALSARGVRAAVLVGGGPADLAAVLASSGARALVVLVGDEDRPDAVELVAATLHRGPGTAVFWQGSAAAPPGFDTHRVRSLAGACHEVVAVLA
jgi:DNA-binding transcriptional MerR regulator